jgi:hypothetical protein
MLPSEPAPPPVEAAAVPSDDVDELPAEVVLDDEVVVEVDPVVIALETPPTAPEVEEASDPPEYVVPHDADVDVAVFGALPAPPEADEASELPDYVVATEDTDDSGRIAAFPTLAPDPPLLAASDLPDYVVVADDLPVAVDPPPSDYPELPDLGVASEALEETDAALRRIREQLTTDDVRARKRRLRRGFTVASGIGAMAALGMLAVDTELGVRVLGL